MQDPLIRRHDKALEIVKAASQSAKRYFNDTDTLVIEACPGMYSQLLNICNEAYLK